LRNKAQLKTSIRDHAIPTAPFFVLDFATIHNDQEAHALAGQIQSTLLNYNEISAFRLGKKDAPLLFRKPVCGVACGGGGKIASLEALTQWMINGGKTGGRPKGVYLLERYITGREFWAIVCLLPSGQWRPLYVVDFELGDCLRHGQPVSFFSRRFETAEREGLFPGITAFVGRCIQALRPPHPHVFCVQGFQLAPRTDSYVFTECGYRLNGARGTGIGYGSSGVSLETALFSTHLDKGYQADQCPLHAASPRWEAQIWWPYRQGALRSHNHARLEDGKQQQLSSRTEFKWYVEPGTVMGPAVTLAHFMASVRLTSSESEEALKEDVNWVMDNWTPDVVEEERASGEITRIDACSPTVVVDSEDEGMVERDGIDEYKATPACGGE